jgi:hypothetical protein
LKFLESPIALLAALGSAIFVFGIGLTSPVWLILGGLRPDQAISTGTPIVEVAILGLAVTAGLGMLVGHLRKPTPREQAPVVPPSPAAEHRKHVITHVIVMLMFIVPFLTIILGVVFNKLVNLSPN